MTRRYMIDTNIASYILKGTSAAARDRLDGLLGNQVASISTLTEGELRYGIAKSSKAFQLLKPMEYFFRRMQVLDWGREEAYAYGHLRAKQERAGKMLDTIDLLIAAHSITIGAVLVTNDNVFRQVPDLVGIENWATDL